MKLLQKYSRINLLTTVIILLLAGIAFYIVLNYIFIKQMDEDLLVEQHEIVSSVQKNNRLPETISSDDEFTVYRNAVAYSPELRYRTVTLHEEDSEEYRQIRFYVTANNRTYEVTVFKSLENTAHIVRSVILVTSVTVLLLLMASFIINRIVLRRLWGPFYKTMKTVDNYRIGKQNLPPFAKTNIEEFAALNNTLRSTILQAENEYKNLKEFTENASHEMQTPVAVIRSKIDVLIQDENLSESQSKLAQEAYTAIRKLTRLNHALLLLSKIENRQFSDKEKVNLQKLLEEKTASFNEILTGKEIHLSSVIEHAEAEMNPMLADILLNNLFSNAIKHSVRGAMLNISLKKNELSFYNGPGIAALDGTAIFKRFHKGGSGADRHGLGLAIVKEICIASGFDIQYSFTGNMHCFTIEFQ